MGIGDDGFSAFCQEVLKIDKNIRYAAIADRFGKLLAARYRNNSIPLLSDEEARLSALQSSIRMGSRKVEQPKLGKVVYAFTLFEKVKRATIPLGDHSSLLVSFDTKADHEPIILKKVLPHAKKRGLIKH